jgi:hypothetical protein
MPVVAVVEGAKVAFYANEHPPAHFHVLFAEHRAVVYIASLTITAGGLPAAKLRKILAWAASRQDALRARFEAALAHERVEPIA